MFLVFSLTVDCRKNTYMRILYLLTSSSEISAILLKFLSSSLSNPTGLASTKILVTQMHFDLLRIFKVSEECLDLLHRSIHNTVHLQGRQIQITITRTYRPTDVEGNTYGIVLASGKRWAEQRKFFSQYLANSKDSFNDIIGDEASRLCNQGGIKYLARSWNISAKYWPNMALF